MQTLLITGANRGLGLEFVKQYAKEGWTIIACCRHPVKAEKLRALALAHKNISVEALDVGDSKAIATLAAKLKNTAIDLLINNAGIFSGGKPAGVSPNKIDKGQQFGSIDPEEWDRVLRTNTIAPIMVAQAFTPHLERGKHRKIVNITSKMGSLESMGPDYIAYRTSKTALNAAMRTICSDLKERKITIVNFHPGWVQTDMGGPEAPLVAEKSIAGMRKVIAGLSLKQAGQFIGYDGKVIPW